MRPFPADCVEPSEIRGPIRVCYPEEVAAGETMTFELTAECASCQQFAASCFIGATGRDISIEMGLVHCPESLACRECESECTVEVQDCTYTTEEAGTYTVQLEGRETAFELRVGRATSDARTCVTL